MTDNEIKKALEVCHFSCGCSDCPYKGCITDSCIETMKSDALDLINRQQSKIERLEAKCENTQIGYNFAKADIERLDKELIEEKLRKEMLHYTVEEIKAEAIKEFANDLYKKFAGHSDYHGDTILTKIVCMAEGQEVDIAKPLDTDNIKIKAIKECLGKIEQIDVSESDDYIMVKKYKFDNLVKEMVGEE